MKHAFMKMKIFVYRDIIILCSDGDMEQKYDM